MGLELLDKPEAATDIITMDYDAILNTLPHRYPFLLVDRVTRWDKARREIEGYKNVTFNEPFFQGHFPGKPVMPGVLIIEAMAQLGALFILNLPEGEGKLALFGALNNVRFRRPVVPGDRLELYSKLHKLRGPVGKAYGRALVSGGLVCEGEMTFSLVPRDWRPEVQSYD